MPVHPIRNAFSAVAVLLLAAACTVKDAEVGPYTVTLIEKNVYHIQDYNTGNPAGEIFNEYNVRTHFNNCSDMYLLVGQREALLIDLSNRITWADDADASLRAIIWERAGGKPLTITFTHNHGDHTGMLPAFVNDPGVQFALPETDFQRLSARFPASRQRFINGGDRFDLGGLEVETLEVPGHTPGSMVFSLKGHNLLFSGDAIGSGHGVWIFDEESFQAFASSVPHLIEWLGDPARGIDPGQLRIFGGHYWQRDWLGLPEGQEMGMPYLQDMIRLIDDIKNGTALQEPSGLQFAALDTYFRQGSAIVAWNAAQAEQYSNQHTQTH